MREKASVAIIGAGPSGLALAYYLKELKIDSLLIEMDEKVGGSWAKMPDNLTLVSCWKSNYLLPADRKLYGPNTFLSAKEFQSYLQNIFFKNQFKALLNFLVTSIEKVGTEFLIKSEDGKVIVANYVVDCRGYYSFPFTPQYPIIDCSIPVFHSADYKNAEMFSSYKKILIVGKKLTAGQIIKELSGGESGGKHEISVSCRGKIHYSPPAFLLSLLVRYSSPLETFLKWIGLSKKFNIMVLLDHSVKAIIESKVTIYSDIKKIEKKEITFIDGKTSVFDAIIFATGFNPPKFSLKNDFERDDLENYFILGRDGQRSFTSRFLRGIREDAPVLAQLIRKRVINED